MRLLVISHTPHYRHASGGVVAWAPTVRELDELATRFETVRHVAVLHDEPAPANCVAYAAKNVELVPVPPSGGNGWRAKLGVFGASRAYVRSILRELAVADFVHVRAPANVSLVAILVLALKRRPTRRWFKYAGSWQPERFDHMSYAVQRWLLRSHVAGGLVTINADPDGDRASWIRAFYNPSLDDATLARGKRAAERKQLTPPIRGVFVGRIDDIKGAPVAVEIIRRCVELDIDIALDLVGDGPARAELEARAKALGLASRVRFTGWLPPERVLELYEPAHLSLLPSRTEGWPKVLSEAMAFGVVPVASRVGAIPAYLERWRIGAAVEITAIDDYVAAIAAYAHDPERWRLESKRAAEAAAVFTFRHYLEAVDALLDEVNACAS